MEYITKIRDGSVLLPFDVENGIVYAVRSRNGKDVVVLDNNRYAALLKRLSGQGKNYLASITRMAEIDGNCLHLGDNFNYSDDTIVVTPCDNRINVKFLRGNVNLAKQTTSKESAA